MSLVLEAPLRPSNCRTPPLPSAASSFGPFLAESVVAGEVEVVVVEKGKKVGEEEEVRCRGERLREEEEEEGGVWVIFICDMRVGLTNAIILRGDEKMADEAKQAAAKVDVVTLILKGERR